MLVAGKRGALLQRLLVGTLVVGGTIWSVDVLAQKTPAPTEPPAGQTLGVVGEVVVIGVSPLLGLGINADKVPNTTRILRTQDLFRDGQPSLTDALESQIGSVNLNAVQGNAFQPDLNFRGFTASPVEGTPIGIAVYQNGVRVNEGFGDTVNWDLIPTFAIRSLNLTSANPVYGFNALGGAIALELKNAFNYQPKDQRVLGDLSAGSFGRRAGLGEYATKRGNWGFYVGANVADESGWRINMPSRVNQLHSDIGYEDGRTTVHLTFTGAETGLGGTGPTALGLLNQNWGNAQNYPGRTQNKMQMFSLNASHSLTDTWSLQANLYNRRFDQELNDGAPSSADDCATAGTGAGPAGFFCTTNRFTNAPVPLRDQYGRMVPTSIARPNPRGDSAFFVGENDRALTGTNTWGGTMQAISAAKVFGYDNHFVVGGSLIQADTSFQSIPFVGNLDDSRTVVNTIAVDSPGGTGQIAQLNLKATNTYGGVYASNTLELTPALALTLNGRYNRAAVRLDDELGRGLNGTSKYTRFNPGGGITFEVNSQLTAFAGYAENNRVPTPAELSCADPSQPCTLASFFVADPPLKQVVAKTKEAGLRGLLVTPWRGRVQWSVIGFRTNNRDDIISVASPIPQHGFFQNAGSSRRQGLELSTLYSDRNWRLGLDYTLLDATFQSNILINSPFHPNAVAGTIRVRPGNVIPGLPRHRVKLSADYVVIPGWTVGGTVLAASNQVLRGDESNQTSHLPGYSILRLRTTYSMSEQWQLWAFINNVTNRKYYTFGTYSSVQGLPLPAGVTEANLNSVRSYGPGAPFGVWVGLRSTY